MRRRALLAAGFVAAACGPLGCRKRKRARRFPGTPPPGTGGVHFVYEVDVPRPFEAGVGREALLARTVDVLRRRVDQLTASGEVRPLASGAGVEVFLPNGRVHIMTSSSPSLDPALLSEEVEDLALVLNSGPLPAPIRLMAEEQVSPPRPAGARPGG
jgi:preprotein translocase subunit SecD